jgi:hypothetical protein
MSKQLDECCQEHCKHIATRIVHWPGRVPPPKMCLFHSIQAIRVMDALGLTLTCEPINEDYHKPELPSQVPQQEQE